MTFSANDSNIELIFFFFDSVLLAMSWIKNTSLLPNGPIGFSLEVSND
jgi:hypothetical protein